MKTYMNYVSHASSDSNEIVQRRVQVNCNWFFAFWVLAFVFLFDYIAMIAI